MITRIMIAEDNTFVIPCYQNFLSKDKTIEIIGYASDGESTIKMYKELNPDLLLLDLRMPKKNGLEVLNDLSNYEGENIKSNIIVVSGDDELRHKLFDTRKVYRIIPKVNNFDLIEKAVYDFKKEQKQYSLSEKQCQNLLIKLNLNPYTRNGRLLIEAIRLCYNDVDLLDNIKQIYYILGYKYSYSPEKVKSSLRSIIETANKYSNSTILNSIFFIPKDNKNKTIPPKHFINGIVVYLKNNKKIYN